MYVITPHRVPRFDRISVLAATILLAYALMQYVDLPTRDLAIEAWGIGFDLVLNVNTVIILLVVGLTVSGVDWSLRGHPTLENRRTVQHWYLPGLATWVLGLTLSQLESGYLWWAVFAVGAVVLIMILVAEYTVVDAADSRYNVASLLLTALSFVLYLILVINLRARETRLLLILPALSISAGLVSLRTIYLQLYRQDILLPENITTAGYASVVVAIVLGQVGAALHYWPISPIAYALGLVGPAYALTIFLNNLTDSEKTSRSLLEPLIILAVMWGMAVWAR